MRQNNQDIAVDDLVWVWDEGMDQKSLRHFSHYSRDNKPFAFVMGLNSTTHRLLENVTLEWDCVELAESKE